MKNKGFTLIELLVAIAIMGVIVLMALPAVRRVQLDNKDKKYVAYEKTVKAATKLFVDSYDEDLFGYINSGCSKVTYDDLEAKKLIEGIQVEGVSCKNANTYIFVMKDRSKNHHYAINIECRDASGEVVYSHKEDPDRTTCGFEEPGKEDVNAPILTIINDNKLSSSQYIDSPYNNGKVQNTAKYPKMRLVIEDKNLTNGVQAVGLRPGHQKLKYQWYKDGQKMTGSNTGSNNEYLNVKVKDYYSPIGKADIPVPTADMAKAEPDARYALRVYGTIVDMDGNKKETTINYNSAWKPSDYPDSSHEGYEVEKHSKCPTLAFKVGNDTASVESTRWYNTNREQVKLNITETTTVIARFDAYQYKLYKNYRTNKGSFAADFTLRNTLEGKTQVLNVGNGINGVEKYTIKYQKKNGSTWYTCGTTGEYGYDHVKPKLSHNHNGSGAYITSDSIAYPSRKGHKNSFKVSATCSDGESDARLFVDGDKHSDLSFSKTKSSRGSYSFDFECRDKANNKDTGSESGRVLESDAVCGTCATKTYKECEHSDCGTYTKCTQCCYECELASGQHDWECIDCSRPAPQDVSGSCSYSACGKEGTFNKSCRTPACGCEVAYSCWY